MSGRRVLALYGALLLGFAAVVCRLYWLCSNSIRHGNIADTAFCFRRCDKVGLFSRPAKLPPDMDTVPFKVDICSCQAVQLAYT